MSAQIENLNEVLSLPRTGYAFASLVLLNTSTCEDMKQFSYEGLNYVSIPEIRTMLDIPESSYANFDNTISILEQHNFIDTVLLNPETLQRYDRGNRYAKRFVKLSEKGQNLFN